MKKLIALFLCCALFAGLTAACGYTDPDAPTAVDPTAEPGASVVTPADIATEATAAPSETDAPTEATEEHVHNHVNYKGLQSASYTLDDVAAIEGRQPDLTYDVDEATTLYIYNDVELDELLFTQVQFSFGDACNRISCTCGGDEEQSVTIDRILQYMTEQYGEPTASGDTYRWGDGHTANYATLTALNETTVQLAFYFYD